jgi:hypothetical protein
MRSPLRKHERSTFCKYMSASTAVKVISNRTLRWSSPLLFNDPFDVPRELSIGIDSKEIAEAVVCRLSELIKDPPEDISYFSPSIGLLLEALKRGVPEGVKAEILGNIQNVHLSALRSGKAIEDLRKTWRDWIPEFRILCLTESPTHAAMWLHYADRYQGAVLEFRCIDALDSAWLCAEKVSYPPEKPAVYTARGWAELFTMSVDRTVERIFNMSLYTKAPDWSYENEWRLVKYKRPGESGFYSDYGFHSEELASIYVGPNMRVSDKEEIINLASSYPELKIFEVSLGAFREFNLHAIRG